MKIAEICAAGSGASECRAIGVRDCFCELLWVAEDSAAFLSVPPSSIPI